MKLRRTRNRWTDQAGNAGVAQVELSSPCRRTSATRSALEVLEHGEHAARILGDARSRPEGGLMPIATREQYISMLIPLCGRLNTHQADRGPGRHHDARPDRRRAPAGLP